MRIRAGVVNHWRGPSLCIPWLQVMVFHWRGTPYSHGTTDFSVAFLGLYAWLSIGGAKKEKEENHVAV